MTITNKEWIKAYEHAKKVRDESITSHCDFTTYHYADSLIRLYNVGKRTNDLYQQMLAL